MRSSYVLNVGWHPGAVLTVTSLHRSRVCAVAPEASTTVRTGITWSQRAGLPSWRRLRSTADTPGKPRSVQACLLRLVNSSG